MVFQSASYLIFFPVVFVLYWLLPRRVQNVFLLAASYFFYAFAGTWFPVLILVATATAYFSAIAMEKEPGRKKFFLIVSVVVNVGLLGVFKYFGFFVSSVSGLLNAIGAPTFTSSLKILLPVGISFYTFKVLSYSIDVYRGKMEVRRNFLDFALFASFFPQLIAGPIDRASDLLPQIEKKRSISPEQALECFYLIVWGFFKKLVIADNVAVTVNKIYMLENPDFALFWTGAFAFCIQIYADFSGYTDISRGCAGLLGFRTARNFAHPYISASPAEFWRRWHISLSFWIRDYIYIPLGGSRVSKSREIYNLVVTFFLCGLWHGAAWNFVIWGLYHGLLIAAQRILRSIIPGWLSRIRILVIPQTIFTFFLITLGWVFFREQDFHYIFKYLSANPFSVTGSQLEIASFLFMQTLVFSIPLWAHDVYSFFRPKWLASGKKPVFYFILKTVMAIIMFIGILVLRSDVSADFIYVNF